MKPIIRCRQLAVYYDDRLAVGPIDCSLPANHKIAILGPNGGGKSSFLKALMGMLPYRGGIDITTETIAYVAQRQEVDWSFPLTALDVTMMGLYRKLGWCRRPGLQHRLAAQRALARLALEDKQDTLIGSLSGGQQQRVFIARALIDEDTRLFLFDEPCAGVDATTERIIYQIFNQLIDEGKSVLCVHHDLQTVADHFDEALLLNQRLVAAGNVAQVLDRTNLSHAYHMPVMEPA